MKTLLVMSLVALAMPSFAQQISVAEACRQLNNYPDACNAVSYCQQNYTAGSCIWTADTKWNLWQTGEALCNTAHVNKNPEARCAEYQQFSCVWEDGGESCIPSAAYQ